MQMFVIALLTDSPYSFILANGITFIIPNEYTSLYITFSLVIRYTFCVHILSMLCISEYHVIYSMIFCDFYVPEVLTLQMFKFCKHFTYCTLCMN